MHQKRINTIEGFSLRRKIQQQDKSLRRTWRVDFVCLGSQNSVKLVFTDRSWSNSLFKAACLQCTPARPVLPSHWNIDSNEEETGCKQQNKLTCKHKKALLFCKQGPPKTFKIKTSKILQIFGLQLFYSEMQCRFLLKPKLN